MKKETTIRIIWERHMSVRNGFEDIEFTIMTTRPDSTETRKYSKMFTITDTDMLTTKAPDVFKRLIEENAIEVFRAFYKENFN